MTLPPLIGKLICLVTRKHRRGVRLTSNSPESLLPHHVYRCPRCLATWTRKRNGLGREEK